MKLQLRRRPAKTIGDIFLTREGDSWTYTDGVITVTGPDPWRVVLGVFEETRKARLEQEKSLGGS
jgi:hypothetical protein